VIEIDVLILFLTTTFVVVLSPGPAAIAVVTEAVSSGFKHSFWIILGIATGNIVFFILSATGIATLIISSSILFSIIKWVGVAYLFYLGFNAIFRKVGPLNLNLPPKNKKKLHKTFLSGFTLEMANPKALLYFSALLPQFINETQPIFPQLAIFCIITFILDLLCYMLYAYLGSKSIVFNDKPLIIKTINRAAGSMLIFTGIKIAAFEK